MVEVGGLLLVVEVLSDEMKWLMVIWSAMLVYCAVLVLARVIQLCFLNDIDLPSEW